MKSKRVYVDKDRDKSLTIKLNVGHYLEATFSIDELDRILITKLYGKNAGRQEYSDDDIYGGEDEV